MKISLVKKLPLLSSSGNPSGLMVVDISPEQFAGILPVEQIQGQFLLMDAGGHLLWEGGMSNFHNESALTSQLTANIQEGGQTAGYFKLNGDVGEGVSWVQSEYNGWNYALAVSLREATKSSRAIAWLTVYICLGVFVCIALAALWGTRRMYEPIRKLEEVVAGGAADDHDSHQGSGDEFFWLQTKFHSLMTSRREMSDQLQSQLPQLKDFFMLKLFSGQTDDKEIMAKSELFHFPEHWTWLNVFVLQIDTFEGTDYREHDKDLLLFAIHNMVGELIPPEEQFSPLVINQSVVTVIASRESDPELQRQWLNERAALVRSKVHEYLKLKISIGVSRSYRRLADTSIGYDEGLEALKYRFVFGLDAILHRDRLELEPVQERLTYPEHLEQELIAAVNIGEPRWAKDILREFIRNILDTKATHTEFQVAMTRLLFRLIDVIQYHGQAILPFFGGKSVLEQLIHCNTAEETEQWFEQSVILPIIEMLEQTRKLSEAGITDQVVAMIREEYDMSLSLEGCAKRLNFHPNYVGRVFKKEMGMSFSDFLNQYRLMLSKRWLKESDMKISEISEKLKYNNAAAFIRYFRNMEGITPGSTGNRSGDERRVSFVTVIV